MLTRCDDIDVAWFEAGRGDPLVLVEGLGDDHRAWPRTVADVVLRRRVILYDLRGHVQTSLGSPDGTLRQLGDDLARFVGEPCDVAGFSLGGTIGMLLGIGRPRPVP